MNRIEQIRAILRGHQYEAAIKAENDNLQLSEEAMALQPVNTSLSMLNDDCFAIPFSDMAEQDDILVENPNSLILA